MWESLVTGHVEGFTPRFLIEGCSLKIMMELRTEKYFVFGPKD